MMTTNNQDIAIPPELPTPFQWVVEFVGLLAPGKYMPHQETKSHLRELCNDEDYPYIWGSPPKRSTFRGLIDSLQDSLRIEMSNVGATGYWYRLTPDSYDAAKRMLREYHEAFDARVDQRYLADKLPREGF